MKGCSGIEKPLKLTSKKSEKQVQVSLEETAVRVLAVFLLMNEEIVSHWHAGWDENIHFQVKELRHLLIAMGPSCHRVSEGLISYQIVDGSYLQ